MRSLRSSLWLRSEVKMPNHFLDSLDGPSHSPQAVFYSVLLALVEGFRAACPRFKRFDALISRAIAHGVRLA
jgi:hypothetical protein